MTLVQLEYIIAVDTYKSFVAAAEKCFVTQPTLSMQIQKLEDSLSIKIFDRSRQPVVATAIGVRIIHQARKILEERDKIQDIIQEESGELSGELKIGVIPTVAPYLLPDVLTNFLKSYPDLRLQIWELTTERIMQDMKIGILDCGILSTPLHDSAIIETPLYYETFVAYLSNQSALAKKKILNTEDIMGEKLWLINEGHCMRGQVLNLCHYKHNETIEGTFDYNTGSVETLKRMVDINGGLTILPELSTFGFDEDQIGQIRHFKNPEPVREISLVTTSGFPKKQAVQALKQEILNVIPDRYKDVKKKKVMTFRG